MSTLCSQRQRNLNEKRGRLAEFLVLLTKPVSFSDPFLYRCRYSFVTFLVEELVLGAQEAW